MIELTDKLNGLEKLDSDDTIFTEKCQELAKAMLNNEIKIHDIVTKLEYLLVNVSPEKRAKGTMILSTVLDNTQDNFLTRTELQFIAAFYADRLKDQHQVIPAVLKGMTALTHKNCISNESVCILLNALFDNVPCQQQLLSDRHNIFCILKKFSKTHKETIQEMGLDFVMGLISAIDGERDPRNLLMLFEWLQELLPTLKLGHLAEEMFDVISCYFPVDFRAPPQDSQFTVTREDLAAHLNLCLCAVPEFAEFCLPLLLEKLNSALKIAKLDSLHLLSESCKTFSMSTYEANCRELWPTLQKEMLNASDPELEEACSQAIMSIVAHLSTSTNEQVTETLSNIYETVRGNMRPDTKLFSPTTKLLLAIARGSKATCTSISEFTIPMLLNLYNIESNSEHQEIIFETVMKFTLLYIEMFEVKDVSEVDIVSKVAIMCLESLQHRNPMIRRIGWRSVSALSNTLSSKLQDVLYKLLKCKITEMESPNVREELLNTFKILAKQEKICMEYLSCDTVLEDVCTLELYLESLCVIIPEPAYTVKVLPLLLNYCMHDNISFVGVAFKCLNRLLKTSSDDRLKQVLYYDFSIITNIMTWIANCIHKELDISLLDDICGTCKLVIGQQSSCEQQKIVTTHMPPLLSNWDLNGRQAPIVIILEGLLSRLRADVEIPDKFNMLSKLVLNCVCLGHTVYSYVCRIIASIMNKSDDQDIVGILHLIEEHVSSVLQENQSDQTQNVIELHSWVTKSLLLKGSLQADHWIEKLINLLDQHEEAAKCFKLIMDESCNCLNKDSYCNVRLLYRQKFFSYVIKKLNDNYRDDKLNYLIAAGYLLQLTPQAIIKLYFKEVFRLMLFCLQLCTNVEALCAVLETLHSLLREKESHLEELSDELLSHFLKLATFQDSMKVRMAALKCIEELPKGHAAYKLLPNKQRVILELNFCLDDKKRLVRKQAVSARSAWFLLDAPT